MRFLLAAMAVMSGCEKSSASRDVPILDPAPTAQDAAPITGGQPITFGKPTVNIAHGTTSVLVEVSNRTDASITCALGATFKKGDTILMLAPGVVNDLPPRGTKTA